MLAEDHMIPLIPQAKQEPAMDNTQHVQSNTPPAAAAVAVNAGQNLLNKTLVVGQDAQLTLSVDALLVLDNSRPSRQAACCGTLNSSKSMPAKTIPFYNVLWAELSHYDVVINYAEPTSSSAVRPAMINYTVEKSDHAHAAAWVAELLRHAYKMAQPQKRLKVLVNPFGGRGSGVKMWQQDVEPIFRAAQCAIDMEETKYNGHGREIAEQIDEEAYDAIVCCSGDGIPYEVFNGLGRKPNASYALRKLAVAQLPCGSGNAASLNLNGTNSPSMAALAIVKGLRTPLDLVSVTQGNTRTLSFLSQAVGIIAEVDLGTEHLRWMGAMRFTWGFLVRLVGKTVYPCDIAVSVVDDSKSSIQNSYRAHRSAINAATVAANQHLPHPSPISPPDIATGLPALKYGRVTDPLPAGWELKPYANMGNFYAGNMSYMTADTNFFQAAQPADGQLDLVCIDGDLPRLAAVQSLQAVENGTFFGKEHVWYRKVDAYRIVPRGWEAKRDLPKGDKREGFISIDGERVPFEPFQVEVHRALGTVLSKNGWHYEAALL